MGRYRAQYVYACPACGHQVEPGWLPAATNGAVTMLLSRQSHVAQRTIVRCRYFTDHVALRPVRCH